MANLFNTYRDQLLNVNDATLGTPQTANIGGITVRCIIEEITVDEMAIAGGLTENGGYRLSCIPKESLPTVPVKGTPVTARGKALELLTITEYNDSNYTVLAGSLLRGE